MGRLVGGCRGDGLGRTPVATPGRRPVCRLPPPAPPIAVTTIVVVALTDGLTCLASVRSWVTVKWLSVTGRVHRTPPVTA